MNLRSISLILMLGLASGGRLWSAETAASAKVVSIQGNSAQVQLAGGELRALKADESLPQGATLVTGPNTTLLIAPLSGTVTAVQPDSRILLEKLSVTTDGGRITKQTAVLDLKSGAIANELDASKRAINDFSVRLGQGVAKAQGTTFAVSFTTAAGGFGGGMNLTGEVTTGNGEVSFTAQDGSKVIIKGGQVMTQAAPSVANPNPTPTILSADEIKASNLTNSLFGALANTAAKVASDPAKYGVDPATAKSELTGTITALVQAAPGSAATIVGSAVRGVDLYHDTNQTGIDKGSDTSLAIAQAAWAGAKGLNDADLKAAVNSIAAGFTTGLSQNPTFDANPGPGGAQRSFNNGFGSSGG